MDIDKAKGYKDQEVLLNALVTFISNQIGRSEQIVKATARQSITEWVTENNTTLREIKHLDEGLRMKIVIEIIDIFLNKVRHIVQGSRQRKKLKENAIQIYEQWKRTKRVDPSNELIDEMEHLIEAE